MTTTAQQWVAEPTPDAARLARIRAVAEAVLPAAVPECMPAMLRDLQAEVDRLTAAARVQRAEVLCEAAEILRRVDLPQAAELLNAQVLLEFVDSTAHLPLRPVVHSYLLRALVAFTDYAGLELHDDGHCASLIATAPGVDQDSFLRALNGFVIVAQRAHP